MGADVLNRRALNRATLARQLLLERSDKSPLAAVEHLVGMQAQIPLNPYIGLWSRLEKFEPDQLATLVWDREVVRIAVMRSTIHLVSAGDCLLLRPLMQPVLDREWPRHQEYGPGLRGVDFAPVLAFVRPLFAERPHTGPQLRTALAERFPEHDSAALAYACRCLLPLVQVPPRGIWGQSSQVTSTTAESWLGRPLATAPSIDDVVLRYLAAFGPATAADVATWSRLTAFREVLDRLRPPLRAFRDEDGRELFDLPDAPRPDPDTPAPPRFLPEYENLLLSHADRTRVIPEELGTPTGPPPPPMQGTVLSDGFLCATWAIDRAHKRGPAILTIHALQRLTKRAAAAVEAEGRRFLRLMAADEGEHEVCLVAAL